MGFAMPGSKPWEFYAAIVAAAMYVFDRAKEHTMVKRTLIVAVSAILGLSVSPDIAARGGYPEPLIGALTITLAYPVLEFISAVVSDRALILDLLLRRGGKK